MFQLIRVAFTPQCWVAGSMTRMLPSGRQQATILAEVVAAASAAVMPPRTATVAMPPATSLAEVERGWRSAG
ncbi:MAG: hypothetical protein R2734_11145 [Nocardioides sp.]